MRSRRRCSKNDGYAHRRHHKSKRLSRARTPELKEYKERKRELSYEDKEEED